ncbi:MAG: membrane protein insertase YidC [Actinobacteria bacterium]|nr:membrane protein insertase YidC [Actinomycetota bacterium]
MNAFGDIWNGIVAGLNFLLQAFYKFSGSYGIAIILLTLLIKMVLLPLTIRQTRSMIAMQKIQPEIRKLQEKYKDDKEKLSQEMMKFYKENKVNPLGGCLPLLLQMPVFFALFTVLRKYLMTPPAIIVGNTFAIFKNLPGFGQGATAAYAALPITKSAGFLWLGNLADTTRTADPTFVLIILLAASTWYSQKQVMSDPRQKNMLIIMPLITAFIGISLPAGVVLYWLTTNILQILQQLGMELYDKRFKKEEKAPIAAKAESAGKKAVAGGAKPGMKAKAGEGKAAVAGKKPAGPQGKKATQPAGRKAEPAGKKGAGTTPARGKGAGGGTPPKPTRGQAPPKKKKPKGPPPHKKR